MNIIINKHRIKENMSKLFENRLWITTIFDSESSSAYKLIIKKQIQKNLNTNKHNT